MTPTAPRRLRRAQADARRSLRRVALATGRPDSTRVRLLYGFLRHPSADAPAWGGGLVQVLHLTRRFPPAWRDFNVFHASSSTLGAVPDAGKLVEIARRRRAPVVLNQDGVDDNPVHPLALRRLDAELILSADHVLFQSAFCKEAADHLVGRREGPWEIFPNAVDSERFSPSPGAADGPPTILLGGNQVQPYRLAVAVEALRHVVDAVPDARLLVAGLVPFPEDELIRRLRLERHVRFLGTHTMREAPDVYRRAHLLLHTRANDPCPNTVLEALATGLPVVHPLSGGVPELVGDAGVGVPGETSIEREIPPDPAPLAEGVLRVLERREELAVAARARAVERFSLSRWLDRYEGLFEGLLQGG